MRDNITHLLGLLAIGLGIVTSTFAVSQALATVAPAYAPMFMTGEFMILCGVFVHYLLPGLRTGQHNPLEGVEGR